MRLRNLIENLEYVELVNFDEDLDVDIEIDGISYNSKRVEPRDLFICLSINSFQRLE